VRIALAMLALAFGAAGTNAAELPCAQVRLVTPYPPGGATDVASRLIAERLEPTLKKPVIVENRAGATGNVGTLAVVNAPADGCTLLNNAAVIATFTASFSKLGYDPVADLVPIGGIGITPTLLVTATANPPNNLKELIGWSREKPDGLNFSTAGYGLLQHLAVEEIAVRSGGKFVHVAYKGEPQAVTDLIPLLAYALNARNADEGRSPFSKAGGGNKVGEKVADERVTLYSDPSDPALLGDPFDALGVPVTRMVWIEKGVLRNLAYSRFWAQKQGKQPTAVPQVGGLALTGGTKSTEEIIAGCTRGILVTHFFYIRALDPRTVLQTGLTRDGAFLIENGKITKALKNFRWNESPLLMLNRLEDIGRPEPTAAGRMMPALRIRDFNFSSLSDAV